MSAATIEQTTEQSFVNIGFLEAGDCEFYRNKNGFLALKYRDKEYPRVQVLRAMPLTRPDVYICVNDMENNELGILESLEGLKEGMAEMVAEELGSRYYCPRISDITSVKEKMSFYYFDVLIGDYKKTFSVKDIGKNIKQLHGEGIMLTDIDGNRYLIPDITKIASKSARQLEPFLY